MMDTWNAKAYYINDCAFFEHYRNLKKTKASEEAFYPTDETVGGVVLKL
jgi:hypothetical protein